ncbi:hypothetical protein ACLIA0_01000 [Bacillaceae bacterium W0354]
MANNNDEHPRSYSEDDNYFEQNRYPVQTNMNDDLDVDTEFAEDVDLAEDVNMDRQAEEDTEFAAETAVFNPSEVNRDIIRQKEQETRMEENVDAGWGWIALVLSLLSFFVWTLLFAVVGAVMGVYAKRRGANTLGNIAIGISIVAVTIRLFFFPII